jgi:murein DD-endopeptidase MepM/ murein hydrolase activator NlpD
LKRNILVFTLFILFLGFILPQSVLIPVKDASAKDWNHNSFWYYPWGNSITHKGIDIFAKEGTPVISATNGIIIYRGTLGVGGKVIMVISSKWRIHYYAHLKDFTACNFTYIHQGDKLGTVGTTGNAAGKPPHLHYSIFSVFPLVWRADGAKQGWLKMFFLNPIELMQK